MYHMFNLYKGLPFPSPVLVSETALGFRRTKETAEMKGGAQKERAREEEGALHWHARCDSLF
jgi:hypothetical protein